MRKLQCTGSVLLGTLAFRYAICMVFSLSLWTLETEVFSTQVHSVIRSVNISDTLPKLTLRLESPAASILKKNLQNPNRIEISLSPCKIGTGLPVFYETDQKPLKSVRILEEDFKVKVVLDFGNNLLPELRITQTGSNLLVMFGAAKDNLKPHEKNSRPLRTPATLTTKKAFKQHAPKTDVRTPADTHKAQKPINKDNRVSAEAEQRSGARVKLSSQQSVPSWSNPAGRSGDHRADSEYEAELNRSFGSRRIGQAECIEVESENVCFFYDQVFLKYADPRDVVKTLDCMFNMYCPGTGQGGPGGGTEHTTTRFTEQNMSPRMVIRDGRDKTKTLKPMDDRGYDKIEELRLMPLPEFPRRPYETGVDVKSWRMLRDLDRKDPRLAKIIAHSMVWADEKKRVVFLKDTEQRLIQIRKVIKSLDRPSLQVLIQSRIVRAHKDWSRGMGILWGGRNNQVGFVKQGEKSYWGFGGNQEGYSSGTDGSANRSTGRITDGKNIPSTFAVNLPVAVANLTNLMGLGVQFGLLKPDFVTELDLRLQFGESSGLAKIVAKPEVQVMDGERAIMKNGSVLTIKTSSPNWGTHTELVPVDLKLEVIPKILFNNQIRMDIDISDNDVNGLPICDDCQIVNLYLAREAHTTLVVENGETCVIGGVIRETDSSRKDGWPFLMKLPILGTLFRSNSAYRASDELLVFITPSIVRSGVQNGLPANHEMLQCATPYE